MPMLEFKGKQHIYAHHLTVPHRPLVPDSGRSLNPVGADDNLIVHGDNRVKCIYGIREPAYP